VTLFLAGCIGAVMLALASFASPAISNGVIDVFGVLFGLFVIATVARITVKAIAWAWKDFL
jgi:hypothetical protein